MWLWWPIEDRDIPFALDPALKSFQKELTQDEHTAEVVGKIIPSYAVGLPFLNFLNSEPRGDFQRNGKTLYAPAHSNPWCDFSKAVHERVQAFTKDNDVTVLVAWNDKKIIGRLNAPVEIGAGVWEITSFYRMRKLFSEYLYALACGMKVGLSARFWNDDIYHPHAISHGLTERAKYVRSLKYLDELYPGIVLEDGLPTYDRCPDIMHTSPFEIARLLEWPVTHTA
jgi:hypothetical protein